MEPQILYGVLYLEINLMASLLVLFIRFKTLGISRMVSQRNFSSAIDAEIVFFLSDTTAVLITCGILPFGEAGLIAAKTVYFFSTALMCFCWFVYFEHLQGSPFVKSRRNVLISSSLVWIMGALLLVNLFTGIFFYVKGGTYYRGPWFILQYILAYVYVFAACGKALVGVFHEKNLSKRRMLAYLALFPVAPAGAGIIQFIYSQLPVACVTLSLATLILYQTGLDDMIPIDPLTKLNNRKQLSFYYEQWQHREESTPLYLLLIDANKFKAINDTYGHIQGDKTLEKEQFHLMVSDLTDIATTEYREAFINIQNRFGEMLEDNRKQVDVTDEEDEIMREKLQMQAALLNANFIAAFKTSEERMIAMLRGEDYQEGETDTITILKNISEEMQGNDDEEVSKLKSGIDQILETAEKEYGNDLEAWYKEVSARPELPADAAGSPDDGTRPPKPEEGEMPEGNPPEEEGAEAGIPFKDHFMVIQEELKGASERIDKQIQELAKEAPEKYQISEETADEASSLLNQLFIVVNISQERICCGSFPGCRSAL
jgi:hypothetical protein